MDYLTPLTHLIITNSGQHDIDIDGRVLPTYTDVQSITIVDQDMRLNIPGSDIDYLIPLALLRVVTPAFKESTMEQLACIQVGISQYGVSWPDCDEDISTNGLIKLAYWYSVIVQISRLAEK